MMEIDPSNVSSNKKHINGKLPRQDFLAQIWSGRKPWFGFFANTFVEGDIASIFLKIGWIYIAYRYRTSNWHLNSWEENKNFRELTEGNKNERRRYNNVVHDKAPTDKAVLKSKHQWSSHESRMKN